MELYQASQYSLAYICGLEIEEPIGSNLIEYLEENPLPGVYFAPGPRGVLVEPEKMKRLMQLKPLLHVNEQEALQLSKAADVKTTAKYLQSLTGNTVIITLEENGTYCLEKNGSSYHLPGIPTKIADTIGAGDSHIGTVLACLVKDIPLKTAISYANLVASTVAGVEGAILTSEQLPIF